MSQPVALREFAKDAWRTLARILHPDWTDEEIDRAWDEFQEFKRRQSLH